MAALLRSPPFLQHPLSRWSSMISAPTRCFASTITTPKVEVPPESPRFISIPESRQEQAVLKNRVKGVLPTPRNIFARRRGGQLKADPKKIAAQTPNPTQSPNLETETALRASRYQWETRLTEQRKRNYRESMNELMQRRERNQRLSAARSARRQKERKLHQWSEGNDARLTRPTITSLMTPAKGRTATDPFSEQRLAAGRARVEEKEAAHSEERRAALQTLYMRARNFITNEDQLNDAIEAAFGTSENPALWKSGVSIWHGGNPPTLEEITNRDTGGYGPDVPKDINKDIMTQRLSKVAEELTGGKI